VREVGVHLQDQVRSRRQGDREAREVGAAETVLRLPVQRADLRELGREPVGDRAGAVRGTVVHDQHGVIEPGRGELRQHGAHDRLHVLGLVVGRQDEPGSGQSGA
jgi:hypothetical protein